MGPAAASILTAVMALAYVSLPSLAIGSQPCVNATFDAALQVFVERLGLSYTDYNWRDSEKFARMIVSLYAQGSITVPQQYRGQSIVLTENSIVAMCKASALLIQTLNDADVDPNSCFTEQFFIANDAEPWDGKLFAGIFNLIRGQCGHLFYPITRNWDCIQRVYNITQAARCIQWVPESLGDWVCDATARSATCFTKIFSDVCYSAEVNYVACETVNNFMDGMFPMCTDMCQVTPVGSNSRAVGQHSTSVEEEALEELEKALSQYAGKYRPVDLRARAGELEFKFSAN